MMVGDAGGVPKSYNIQSNDEYRLNAQSFHYFSGMVVSDVLLLLRPASLFCCFCAFGDDFDEELVVEELSTRSSMGMSSTGSRQKLKLEYSSYWVMSSSFSRIGGNR